ncbi:putative sugar kinase [Halobacteriovorax marinus SJ]|uniref:Sugar kinase n=1 Tax=Halobacteriovorax marinus (strain ATCC BAA-682 / DSM 15412 / SJ) TaxID=862908 RepID=E1X5Q2_HALMS|nr:sugar kinase [Halobacteriovorax marinus]CBW25619.1 putative sugar kinase [Halobacteriovorax marinus SJ]
MAKYSGSVRVDLLGGTLDLEPINLIIPETITLNLATSLKAEVEIEKFEEGKVQIHSLDYNTTETYLTEDFTSEKLIGDHFGHFSFVCQILDYFKLNSGVRVILKSGSPPGAGLGGSSSMGITLFGAICKYLDQDLDRDKAVNVVRGIEGRMLDCGPAGYQDYYPAIFGGVLALCPTPGSVIVDQLFNEDLKKFLEGSITLVYSRQTRLSGITNWEVYKGFFDRDARIRKGLSDIAKLSQEAYQKIKNSDYAPLASLISREGAIRKELFPGIVSEKMDMVYNKVVEKVPSAGMKVCGAGGGGCFLIVHPADKKEDVEKIIQENEMDILPFAIEKPL